MRPRRPACESAGYREDIDGQRQDLERDEDHEQIVGRRHEHHAAEPNSVSA